jgi:hypothetical protein
VDEGHGCVETLNRKPQIVNPKPYLCGVDEGDGCFETLNRKPQIVNPKPYLCGVDEGDGCVESPWGWLVAPRQQPSPPGCKV